MNTLQALAALLPITGLASIPALAQTLGTEDFNYPNGGIAGRTGGTGFDYNATTATATGTTSDWDALFGGPTIVNGQLVTNESGALREHNGNLEGAGVGLLTAVPDLDSDGLPAYWEAENGLDDQDDGTTGESSPGAKDGPNGALGDPDGDGRTNAQEFADGTHPQQSDSDADGFADGLEISAGTNPANPASYPGADPQPGLIGVEKFDYPEGPIDSRQGGTHWDVDNSLNNGDFTGHTHTSSDWDGAGTTAEVAGSILRTANGGTARREYNGPSTADETSGSINEAADFVNHVVYYRFQMTRRPGAEWGGASSFDFGNERYLFGVPNAANPTSGQREFAIHDLNVNAHAYSGIQPVDNQTYIIAAMLDFDNDLAALYLDPDLTADEAANTPVATYPHTSDNWSSAIRFGSGGGGAVEWDDLRVATNWQALEDGPAEANDDQITLRSGDQARIRVTDNDTGSLNPYSVSIESPPSQGSATLLDDGSVLYQHTAGTSTPDSFTYRVTNAGGDLSDIATVSITVTIDARFETSFVNNAARTAGHGAGGG